MHIAAAAAVCVSVWGVIRRSGRAGGPSIRRCVNQAVYGRRTTQTENELMQRDFDYTHLERLLRRCYALTFACWCENILNTRTYSLGLAQIISAWRHSARWPRRRISVSMRYKHAECGWYMQRSHKTGRKMALFVVHDKIHGHETHHKEFEIELWVK